MNIADALAPYFEGKVPLDKAVSDACKLFLKIFELETFACESCGKIIFPNVTTNEHGIFIESNRAEIRGGKGNRCVKKNICEECSEIMRQSTLDK